MGGLAGAWLVGMGITIWRQVRQSSHLPVPADLVAVTGLFLGLGLISDSFPATRRVIMLTAWGLDIAGLLRVLPAGLFQEAQTAVGAESTAQGQTASSGGGTTAGG